MIYPSGPMSPRRGDAVRALPDVLKVINSSYGAGSIRTGSEYLKENPLERVYSGIPRLDAEIGGVPKGRIITICGNEDSGKTTLALHISRQIGGPVLYLDADNGLGPAQLQGMNCLYRVCPETLEDALEICTCAAVGFSTIVVDTVAALPTRCDLGCRMGDIHGGRQAARILSHALPVLVQKMQRTCCTLILVTQMRNRPGVLYGPIDAPVGGRALGYYAAMRLMVSRLEKTTTGMRVLIAVGKNKYGKPYRRAEVGLLYGRGLVSLEELEAAGCDHKRLAKG